MYRPLHYTPPGGKPTIDLGTDLGIGDTLLLDGILYVDVRDRIGTRINAVDPRRFRVELAFNGTGAIRLRGGLVTSAKLLADGPRRCIVAKTAIDRGQPGERLHVLGLNADGTQDAGFGGRVKRNGGDVVLEHGLEDALVDRAGRLLVLGRESTLVRLDRAGRLDTSFGEEGLVRMRAVRVCALAPAARAAACRKG